MNLSWSIGDKFNPKFSYSSYDLTTEIHCFLYIKKTNESTFHEFAQRTSEIFFQHKERNFVSASGHVMFYLL